MLTNSEYGNDHGQWAEEAEGKWKYMTSKIES